MTNRQAIIVFDVLMVVAGVVATGMAVSAVELANSPATYEQAESLIHLAFMVAIVMGMCYKYSHHDLQE